jgi:FkbM family methyltransferase
MPGPSVAFRLLSGAYRRGILPPRGFGRLFDATPVRWWGGAELTVVTDVGLMTVPVRDHGARQLLVFGRILHEELETAFLRRVLARFHWFVDVGANYGWYTRLASAVLAPDSAIIAIEANAGLIPYLRRNVELGTTDANPEVIAGLAWDGSGEVSFHVAENSALSSAVRSAGVALDVPACTLDGLASDRGLRSWGFVKCDVEGGELHVLRGARAVRGSPTPPVWMLEADGAILRQAGGSYEALERELGGTESVELYTVASPTRLAPLAALRDLAGTGRVNVIVVPHRARELLADVLP